jgi:hypothetical protein
LVSPGNAPRRCRRHADDLEPETVDQLRRFLTDIAPSGNDQRLGNRARRDQQTILGFERGGAGVRLGLVQQDCHQRGRVDRDHPGRPSSP